MEEENLQLFGNINQSFIDETSIFLATSIYQNRECKSFIVDHITHNELVFSPAHIASLIPQKGGF